MADAMDTLKSLLGDDAEDKIKNVMSTFGNNESRVNSTGGSGMENLEYLMQMKDIASKLTNSQNDSRSRLLLSLKPYMREERRQSIDKAVKLLSLTKLSELFRQ